MPSSMFSVYLRLIEASDGGLATALAKGFTILAFGGIGVLAEIGVKIAEGVPPASVWMFVFGGLALVANLSCLRLLWRVRTIDINMSSTFECSRNDVISNFGVLAAAVGVVVFQSAWPDIIVGVTIAFVFFRSAGRVIREAWPQFRSGALVRYPAE